MGAHPSQPTCELLPSLAPHQGLYISQFQVKNLGARTKNPRKILPSSNTSKPMALRKILSVVPPHLPQSLAPVPPKECSLHSPKPHLWLEAQLMDPALLRTCLALSSHSTFGNSYLPFISASSITPPEHQCCGPCPWDMGRAKIHPPIFTVGKRRHQGKKLSLVLLTCSSDPQTDRLSHPLHRRSLIRSL